MIWKCWRRSSATQSQLRQWSRPPCTRIEQRLVVIAPIDVVKLEPLRIEVVRSRPDDAIGHAAGLSTKAMTLWAKLQVRPDLVERRARRAHDELDVGVADDERRRDHRWRRRPPVPPSRSQDRRTVRFAHRRAEHPDWSTFFSGANGMRVAWSCTSSIPQNIPVPRMSPTIGCPESSSFKLRAEPRADFCRALDQPLALHDREHVVGDRARHRMRAVGVEHEVAPWPARSSSTSDSLTAIMPIGM